MDTRVANSKPRKSSKAARAPAPGLPIAIDITVPLNRLVLSPRNVRKSGADAGIPELAARILARGLLQRLAVTDAGDGAYAVEAGGRRLAALTLLAGQGKLAPDAPVICTLHPLEASTAVSLAENSHLPMHPADEFQAYADLAEAHGAGAVALQFGVSELTVRRRLKLGRVAPRFIGMYRQGQIEADELQALALVDDHELQCRVYDGLSTWDRDARAIRAALQQNSVRADSALAKFVGLEAYEAAGGVVIRDLFAEPDALSGMQLQDLDLLHRLADAKLRAAGAEVEAEGWKWVEYSLTDRARDRSFGREEQAQRELTEAERQAMLTLQGELRTAQDVLDALLEADADDESADTAYFEADQRIGAIEAQLRAAELACASWTDTQKTRAGAMVFLSGGRVEIERGLVRPEDKKSVAVAIERSGERIPQSVQTGARPAISEKLMRNLTAHRTGAMQAAMVQNPFVALVCLVYTLARPRFTDRPCMGGSALQITAQGASYRELCEQGSEFATSQAAEVMADAAHLWGDRLPGDHEALFKWLLVQDVEGLMELLAYCTACSLDAVEGRERTDHNDSDSMARALGLDMADWWEATAPKYFHHVSKAKAAEAVREGTSRDVLKDLSALKRVEAAEFAAKQVEGRRWLPRPLRASSE